MPTHVCNSHTRVRAHRPEEERRVGCAQSVGVLPQAAHEAASRWQVLSACPQFWQRAQSATWCGQKQQPNLFGEATAHEASVPMSSAARRDMAPADAAT